MAHSSNRVVIRNVNEAYIRIECEEGIAYELHAHFEFEVPGAKFSPQYRARLWNGKINLFSLRTRQIYRGLAPHIARFCAERDYSCEYVDESFDTEFSLTEAESFIKTICLPFFPRDYQIEAFTHTIRTRRALLLSSTGSGKSLIIYMILRYLHDVLECKKTLIIVPTVSLVTQMVSDFKDYGYDAETFCHKIYAGEDKTTEKPITVSTWQSLFKMPKAYFDQFEIVIGDECHLAKAKSLTTILSQCTKAKYRIGTTGTLDGTATNKMVIEGLFGEVRRVSSTKDLIDKKVLADFSIKCLVLKHPESVCQAAKNFTYQQEIEYLVLNEARNRFIKNLALSLKGNTLLLFQYVDKHGKILHSLISDELKSNSNRKVFFISGETDADVREDIRRLVETETDAILVASFGVYSTGINLRNLHNIIFASPSKSRVRNLQSIGRGLRTSETKTSAVLYDLADDLKWKKHENFTIKHFQERLKIYAEEKFKFKLYKVALKG